MSCNVRRKKLTHDKHRMRYLCFTCRKAVSRTRDERCTVCGGETRAYWPYEIPSSRDVKAWDRLARRWWLRFDDLQPTDWNASMRSRAPWAIGPRWWR